MKRTILFLIPYLSNKIFVLLVFSAKTKSTSSKIETPLKVKSFKFPIGVATKYNVPFELMIYSPFKILIYTSIISLFLSCASVGDKNFEEFSFNLPSNIVTKKIYREIMNVSMGKDFEIIQSENLNKKESIFTQGFLASYYLNNKYSNKRKKVFFISESKKLSSCEKNNKSNVVHIIFRSSLNENLLKKCNFEKSRTYVINLGNRDSLYDFKEISIRNQIFFDDPGILKIIKDNKFILISSRIEEIEKFKSLTKKNNLIINEENLIFLEKNNDFESIVSEIFGQKESLKRNRNIERIINRDLQFTSRKRQDINSIILSSNSETTKRLLPALKFNLLQDLKIFNMPNHYDVWSNSSNPNDLNPSKGLEYPILANKVNFGDHEFSKLTSSEKIIYSLGFDTLGVVSNKNYFGFLGQYTFKDNRIILQPISLDFKEDQIMQRF